MLKGGPLFYWRTLQRIYSPEISWLRLVLEVLLQIWESRYFIHYWGHHVKLLMSCNIAILDSLCFQGLTSSFGLFMLFSTFYKQRSLMLLLNLNSCDESGVLWACLEQIRFKQRRILVYFALVKALCRLLALLLLSLPLDLGHLQLCALLCVLLLSAMEVPVLELLYEECLMVVRSCHCSCLRVVLVIDILLWVNH